MTMESEKPFRTIEVIDSRTGQLCKVACMSCIRGHRTVSCGSAVCRNKIFWTIKRPGRPSNTCTCRFSGTGKCLCSVASEKCPHKGKKGGKGRVDCNCNEQGRYCCLLEPVHWQVLCSLGKPIVNFFPRKEDLQAHTTTNTAQSDPATPSHPTGSPTSMLSTPGTPSSHGSTQTPQVQNPTWRNIQPRPSLPTRFGMMGVGLPMGSEGHEGDDVFTWNNHAPEAPREWPAYSGYDPSDANTAMTVASGNPELSTVFAQPSANDMPYENSDFAPVGQSFQDMNITVQQQAPEEFDIDKLMTDYLNYQFPSAICQNCGMGGCTCRNCPAVMQNAQNGSWAQCCSRKHVQAAHSHPQQPLLVQNSIANNIHQLNIVSDTSDPFASDIDVDTLRFLHGGSDPVDISEILMNDLERPSQTSGGCCGGDMVNNFEQPPQKSGGCCGGD